MRSFGGICLFAGIALFFYAGEQQGKYEPVPPYTSVAKSLDYPAGRWEVARYGGAAAAAVGLLLTLAPKGR
jgi:hypothetical protein